MKRNGSESFADVKEHILSPLAVLLFRFVFTCRKAEVSCRVLITPVSVFSHRTIPLSSSLHLGSVDSLLCSLRQELPYLSSLVSSLSLLSLPFLSESSLPSLLCSLSPRSSGLVFTSRSVVSVRLSRFAFWCLLHPPARTRSTTGLTSWWCTKTCERKQAVARAFRDVETSHVERVTQPWMASWKTVQRKL